MSLEDIRTARRRWIIRLVYPSLFAACLGLDYGPGSCGPFEALFLVGPMVFVLTLLAADILGTVGRGGPRYAKPTYTAIYRIVTIGLPILILVIAHMTTRAAAPAPCQWP